MLSAKLIRHIKKLRRKGRSVPEISRECSISKSTALRYISGIKIEPKYYQRWLDRRNASKILSEKHWEFAHEDAKSFVDAASREGLALIAASLYWAEGNKKDLSFTNTDSEMIKLFLYILRNIFNIKDEDLKISIRTYEDLDANECLKFWSGVVGIKLDRNNTSINVLEGSKKGKLKYGMCRVRVRRGGLLLKKFSAIIKRVISLIDAPVVQGIEQGTPKP